MRIWVLGWSIWLFCGLAFAQTSPNSLPADRVVVLKKERTLQLLRQGRGIKTYKVALGGDPIGAKAQQGDHKDSGRNLCVGLTQPAQPVLEVDPYFLSQRE